MSVECRLAAAMARRRGDWPLFWEGEAVFGSDDPMSVAGEFNDWRVGALRTAPICEGALHVARIRLDPGRYEYKLVEGEDGWELDPENPGFAYDDFEGNAQGRNSVVNTPDSGVGRLVTGPQLCFAQGGAACPRQMIAYMPRGYDPGRAAGAYPVLFMTDGQNVFDDTDCCFGHTGWEINRTLDRLIADGSVEEIVVVAVDHGGGARAAEYAAPEAIGGVHGAFVDWWATDVHDAAAGRWAVDPGRAYVAGSSLGGLFALVVAAERPGLYRGAASLSGAFWYGEEEGASMFERMRAAGKQQLALYLDHGGSAARGGDNYEPNQRMLTLLDELGWQRRAWPDCAAPGGPDDLCHWHDPGASHDELAWRDRSHAFLRFLLAPIP